jgi:hypothetical protein
VCDIPYWIHWKSEEFHISFLVCHQGDAGGSTDLCNIGKLIPAYMALQPRRQPSSCHILVKIDWDQETTVEGKSVAAEWQKRSCIMDWTVNFWCLDGFKWDHVVGRKFESGACKRKRKGALG